MATPKIVCVVGTRPEGIKMAPVVLELRRFSDRIDTVLVSTGQHREMLAQALGSFGLEADIDLGIMQHGQTLAQVTSRALEGIDKVIVDEEPAFILGQGDTTTCFAASLGAFYRQTPFGHIEAGLRTETIDNPFPEEFNRRATGLIANLHLAPTTWARDNLLKEGKSPHDVVVTGNTGIDAVLVAAERSQEKWEFDGTRVILLTTHRRENWGEPQHRIARAARRLLDAHPKARLVVAMHRNPKVMETLQSELGDHDRASLIEPPEYMGFVKLMQRADLILTDSGGVQEEAPAFGVPVLVLRETTERPEGVTAGTAQLVGTDENAIFERGDELLSDSSSYERMAKAVSPYGDGKAAQRVRYAVLRRLGIDSPAESFWGDGE